MSILRAMIICMAFFGSLPVMATTLYLNEALELLLADGIPMRSGLLRNVGNLELAAGRHQLVFLAHIANDALAGPAANKPIYIVAMFNTTRARELRFQLPPLITPANVGQFARQPTLILLDEHNTQLNAAYSSIDVDEEGVIIAWRNYTRQYGPIFPLSEKHVGATGNQSDDCVPSPLIADDHTLGKIQQILRFWFLPAKEPT
jgi:uncharacterized protein YccT (UPF0319 family)